MIYQTSLISSILIAISTNYVNADHQPSTTSTHNCLESAGYRWCPSQQKCIQVSNNWNQDCQGSEYCPSGQIWCDSQQKCIMQIGGQCPTCPSNKPRWCYTSNSCYNPIGGICYGPLDADADLDDLDDYLSTTDTPMVLTGDSSDIYSSDNSGYSSHSGDSSDIVGNDADIHGCRASAGYEWCPLYGKCIRPWIQYCIPSGDIHGCRASAGYHWCPSKSKCIRLWEEICPYCQTGEQYCDTLQECYHNIGGYCPSCPKNEVYHKESDSCIPLVTTPPNQGGTLVELVNTPPTDSLVTVIFNKSEFKAKIIVILKDNGIDASGTCSFDVTKISLKVNSNDLYIVDVSASCSGYNNGDKFYFKLQFKWVSGTININSLEYVTPSNQGATLVELVNTPPTDSLVTAIFKKSEFNAKIIVILKDNGINAAGTCSFDVTKISLKVNSNDLYIAHVSASCSSYNNGNKFYFELQFKWVSGTININSLQYVSSSDSSDSSVSSVSSVSLDDSSDDYLGGTLVDLVNTPPTDSLVKIIFNKSEFKAKIIVILKDNGIDAAGTCSFDVTQISLKVNSNDLYIAHVSASCSGYNNGNKFYFELQFKWVSGTININSLQYVTQSVSSDSSRRRGRRLLELVNTPPTDSAVTIIFNKTEYKAKIIVILKENGIDTAGTCSFDVTKISLKVNSDDLYIADVSASCSGYNNGDKFYFKLQFKWVSGTCNINSLEYVQ